MNMHGTLSRIFPTGIISDCIAESGGNFEVRGLNTSVGPQNCEILARSRARWSHNEGYRESYVVRTADFLLFFRICSSGLRAGDLSFGISRGYAHANDAQSRGLQVLARKAIASLRQEAASATH